MALILVTGASTGLGLATVRALTDDGHDVVLHARDLDRVEDRALLDRVAGTVVADLADADAVAGLPAQLAAAGVDGRLDAVVHNAGVMTGGDVLAVNVLAPYLLTAALAAAGSSPRRSVVLSSSMHRSGSADATRPALDPARTSYGDSKLLVTALTLGLARRRPDELWHAVDPGWVPTRMGGASAPDDLEEGHRTQAWLAVAPEGEVEPRTGGYWRHHHVDRLHQLAADEGFQDRLLDRLAEVTGVSLP